MTDPLSKNQVKKAGRVLADRTVDGPRAEWARSVADKWRSAHREPLEEMERIVRDAARELFGEVDGVFIASRIKRLDSIIGKLRRPGLSVKLNEMNDIAGCRIVVPAIEDVWPLVERLRAVSPLKDVNGVKDYIGHPHPRGDGYRSIHLITRHDAESVGLRGLFCETQVRTRLQHAWATALETYDVAEREMLKFGAGSREASRFFLLASALFAEMEGMPMVAGVPASTGEVLEELRSIEGRAHIADKLRACSGSVTILSGEEFSEAAYCVLDIDYELQYTKLYLFPEKDASSAEALCFKLEQRERRGDALLKDALLVKVSSLKNLKEAYPNYLTDVRAFLDVIDRCLAR